MQHSINYTTTNVLIHLISTSGESDNIIEAAKWTADNEIKLVTFSGKKKTNRLNKFNKNNLNFWVDSNAYNHVELIHLALLLNIIDYIIGTSVYKA
jgi:D-sedoheptulose 7-phosphate isomerase